MLASNRVLRLIYPLIIPYNQKRKISGFWREKKDIKFISKWVLRSMFGGFLGIAIGITAYSVGYPMSKCSEWFCERIPLIQRIVVAVHEYGFDERYSDIKEIRKMKDNDDNEERFAPYLSWKTNKHLEEVVKTKEIEKSDERNNSKKDECCKKKSSESFELLEKENSDRSSETSLETSVSKLPEQPVHSSMQALMDSIKEIEKAVHNSNAVDEFKKSLKILKQEAYSLNSFLEHIDNESNTTLNKKLTEQKDYFEDLLKIQEKTLQTQMENQETYWISALLHEYERLEILYRERLLEALKKQEEVNEKKLKNELIQQAIELQRRWMREMKARVEEQRGGRLGQLEHLYKHLKHLEILFSQTKNFSENIIHIQRLQIAFQALRRTIEDPQQKPFTKELNVLKDLCKNDEFIQLAVASIQPESHQQGIMSKTQLIHRFQHLAQEIHKVSLCPDNTGVLGYIFSRFLTFFMFQKTAFTDGNHVHHILARAETHLKKNNLDAATRELNQLTGVPRKLARDWLKYARQNLEVLQALYMIETYTLLQSILFV
ncbi:hypothetical protein PNEG_03091 [Pneumocystis murina B123]|uniref:MICOS complex subunit MIC60 n=1 Tax=Pneumocystis murina (strain B123) TaxID=1069680 RepID=M7P422_PNEMU|nr:hypothetical protein PNEG_03091 [Pneumocystis murina B123]EMR08615.1 hypothetical protein PNEG_03091 [Pneumocystis murina B123]